MQGPWNVIHLRGARQLSLNNSISFSSEAVLSFGSTLCGDLKSPPEGALSYAVELHEGRRRITCLAQDGGL
jgi:hypothetical protein